LAAGEVMCMMNAQSDTNTVHEATLILLERTGVRVECEAALDLFAQHGVRVDHASQRVYPGVEQIEQALSGAPRAIRVYGRSPHDCLTIGGENAYTLSGGASLRVLTLDGRYEPATLEHLRQFNILLDALPNVHMCVNQVDPEEFRGPQLYRRLAAEMFIGCRKPICFQAASAADVTAMVEMGAAIRGSPAALAAQPMFMIGLNAEPPLSISRDTAEALIATCHADIPCSLGNYNMLGITAPITVAGAALQLNAVQLAAILLAQLVRPGVAMFYTAFSGSGNMRTLDVIAADPQAIQQQRLTAQLGRSYGLPVYVVSPALMRACPMPRQPPNMPCSST
jgi:trimethylamine--corrinoid protein Co-methyltransferase